MLHKVSIPIVTAADGAATVYLGSKLRGRVHAIQYVKGTLANPTTMVLTGETTGVAILTDAAADSEWFYPRSFANKVTDGAADASPTEDIHVLNERIKVVITGGGNGGVGSISAFIDMEN